MRKVILYVGIDKKKSLDLDVIFENKRQAAVLDKYSDQLKHKTLSIVKPNSDECLSITGERTVCGYSLELRQPQEHINDSYYLRLINHALNNCNKFAVDCCYEAWKGKDNPYKPHEYQNEGDCYVGGIDYRDGTSFYTYSTRYFFNSIKAEIRSLQDPHIYEYERPVVTEDTRLKVSYDLFYDLIEKRYNYKYIRIYMDLQNMIKFLETQLTHEGSLNVLFMHFYNRHRRGFVRK